MKQLIIISGVSLTEMGPLAVFKEALSSLAENYGETHDIIALVHREDLLTVPGVSYLEFPYIKSSWLKRLWFEFWVSMQISRKYRPQFWLSMDNVTPRIVAGMQAVYCHNPSPFYRFNFGDLLLDWKFGLFTLFYRYLYAINIRRNDHVIVQQDWIRKRFEARYGVKSVIVAHPAVDAKAIEKAVVNPSENRKYTFFYPAFPRTFKNVEVILDAARLLEEGGFHDFEVWLTFDAQATRYADKMVKLYSQVRSVRWLGLLPRDQIFALYGKADCLLFPSKLETWGLPITEFKTTGKPMLVADLPYAHETVGNYEKAAFFDPLNPVTLATSMRSAATQSLVFAPAWEARIEPPFTNGWFELWSLLLKGSDPHLKSR